MNDTAKSILKNSITATVGLFLFAFGVFLTIRADIGVAPWDAFNLGLSSTLGIKYGTANILVSMIIIVIDIAMREQIGIGMFLDAVLVGKFVDLFDFLNLIPYQKKTIMGVLVMTVGMFIMGFAQYFYMKAALGCGPRDSLTVGLKRRTKKIPIGLVITAILAVVTLVGWLLGGKIGIGTVIAALCEGPIMELEFRFMRFDPTAIRHQNISESYKVLRKNGK